MKTLNNILEQSKMYMTGDTDRFVKKHTLKTDKLSKPAEDDAVFKATNIKAVSRSGTNHGYDAGEDEKVYEETNLLEKHLTPAEMKKREEIAKAMERENPGMDKSKKMAIATATAKRVAEEVEQLDEKVVHDQYNKYHEDCIGCMDQIGKHLEAHKKAVMSGTPWNKEKGSNTSEWHVQQVKGLHRQLQDISDNLQQQAEYAEPPKPVKIKEEVELDEGFSVDPTEIIAAIMEDMSEEEKQEFLEIIESDEGCAEVISIIEEAITEAEEE